MQIVKQIRRENTLANSTDKAELFSDVKVPAINSENIIIKNIKIKCKPKVGKNFFNYTLKPQWGKEIKVIVVVSSV